MEENNSVFPDNIIEDIINSMKTNTLTNNIPDKNPFAWDGHLPDGAEKMTNHYVTEVLHQLAESMSNNEIYDYLFDYKWGENPEHKKIPDNETLAKWINIIYEGLSINISTINKLIQWIDNNDKERYVKRVIALRNTVNEIVLFLERDCHVFEKFFPDVHEDFDLTVQRVRKNMVMIDGMAHKLSESVDILTEAFDYDEEPQHEDQSIGETEYQVSHSADDDYPQHEDQSIGETEDQVSHSADDDHPQHENQSIGETVREGKGGDVEDNQEESCQNLSAYREIDKKRRRFTIPDVTELYQIFIDHGVIRSDVSEQYFTDAVEYCCFDVNYILEINLFIYGVGRLWLRYHNRIDKNEIIDYKERFGKELNLNKRLDRSPKVSKAQIKLKYFGESYWSTI